jgi:hypothetical protein
MFVGDLHDTTRNCSSPAARRSFFQAMVLAVGGFWDVFSYVEVGWLSYTVNMFVNWQCVIYGDVQAADAAGRLDIDAAEFDWARRTVHP